MNIRRLTFAALDRLRSLPTSTWVGTALGVVVSWVAVGTLTKAPMTAPVAVGFAWCMFVGIALSLLIGVLLTRFDRHEERLVHLEIRAERLPELPAVVLPEEETPEAEGGDWYAKLRAGAEWVDARMQPTFLEPEPATEPAPVVRPVPTRRALPLEVPSDAPTEVAPATTPMERAWEESAAELTEQQRWEADQEAKYAAAMARIEEMAKGIVT